MPLPYTSDLTRLRRAACGSLAALLVATPARGSSQEASLGLRGIGAVGVTATLSAIERDATGLEGGATVDLGHFASRRIRLGATASFLRTRPRSEYVAQDDTTFRNVFYDLSGHVAIAVLARNPDRRVVPYASFGAGVHVLTSSYGSIPIDIRYNTNVFGLRSAAGVRWRGARRAVSLETAAVLARNVSRATIGVSTEWLFGDLLRSGQ
jgi:hypothetical protein